MKFKKTAELIRSIRTKAGLTQEDLSNLLGLESPQFISNAERAVSTLPAFRLKKIKSLASKEQFLRAYLEDIRQQWIDDYDS